MRRLILTEKRMGFTGNESLHRIDRESIPDRPVFGCITTDKKTQLWGYDVTGAR